MAVKLIYHSES